MSFFKILMRFSFLSFAKLLYWFFYLTLFFVFLNLSVWQYDRGTQKALLLDRFLSIDSSKTSVFQAADYDLGEAFFLDGKFVDSASFVINGRFFKNQLGYEVISLFQVMTGHCYWVNRGWIKRNDDRSWNTWQVSEGDQRLRFYVRQVNDQDVLAPLKFERFNNRIILPYLNVYWLNKLAFPMSCSEDFVLHAFSNQKNVFGIDFVSKQRLLKKRKNVHYMYSGQWALIAIVWLFMGFIFRRFHAKK